MHRSSFLASLPVFTLDAESTRRLAFGLTVFLLFFEAYVVRVSYSDHFIQLLETDSTLFFFMTGGFLVLSVYLVYRFIYAALSAGWAHRIAYLLVLTLSFAAEYSYQKALGRFSEIVDIELAVATTYDQKIASLMMYFSFAAFVPIIAFVILLAFTKGRGENSSRNLLVVNALLVCTLLAGSVMSLSRFPTVSTYAFYRTNVEFLLFGPVARGKWGAQVTGIKLQRIPVAVPEPVGGRRPNNNIVFVIDESVRGDHFSLNGYHRDTTPFLKELNRRGVLNNWGNSAAATTGSQSSYNAMITGLTPDDFPDPGDMKIYSTPTVFQYAKAMGYTTWFFDAQMNNFWGGIPEDEDRVDHWFGSNDLADPNKWGKWDIDTEIGRRVNNIIGSSRGNFIFVFKYGSHIPYHFNFPPDHATWQPNYTTFNRYDIPGPERLPEVINAYDNSIKYTVDAFFKNLIADYDQIPNDTVILYTGDHGQTLFENGKASHGGSTVEEALVPLFMIGKLPAQVDTRYKASHCNVLPTLIDLMEYPERFRPAGRCLSLLKAKASDSRPRFFNPVLGKKVPFD